MSVRWVWETTNILNLVEISKPIKRHNLVLLYFCARRHRHCPVCRDSVLATKRPAASAAVAQRIRVPSTSRPFHHVAPNRYVGHIIYIALHCPAFRTSFTHTQMHLYYVAKHCAGVCFWMRSRPSVLCICIGETNTNHMFSNTFVLTNLYKTNTIYFLIQTRRHDGHTICT